MRKKLNVGIYYELIRAILVSLKGTFRWVKVACKKRIKSLFSLLLALLPLIVLGYSHSNNSLREYTELLLVISIPGFLYFIRYEIIRPIVKEEIMKPLAKILTTCTRAICGEKDALEKLRILGEKILEE